MPIKGLKTISDNQPQTEYTNSATLNQTSNPLLWITEKNIVLSLKMGQISHQELNDRQKEAVFHTEGPLLIIAGAGAGKTKTIIHRIAHLIEKGVNPNNILAVTFTNKAASEMKERIRKVLVWEEHSFSPKTNPFIGTFHSLGLSIIKENLKDARLEANFSIFDRGDSIQAIKEVLKRLNIDSETTSPSKIMSAISKRKSNMEEPSDINKRKDGLLSVIWKEYQSILRAENALDFDDILLKAAYLLKYNPNIKERYADRWHYIHIDEYQDTNRLQYEIAKALAEKRKNICVVGDADQNIYSWRGADIKNIIHFEEDYPNAKVVLLEENYRSTSNILSLANRIIAKNKLRKEKNLFTRKESGEKISIFFANDENDEADFVASKVESLLANKVRPKDIAVLIRANFQNRVLEEKFMLRNLPYQIIGTKFFERLEVKTVLAYLKAALGQKSASDIKRILSMPPKGLGKVALLKILANKEEELTPTAKKNFLTLLTVLSDIKNYSENKSVTETIAFIVKRSGIEDYLKKEADGEERLLNISELASFSMRYNDLPPQEALSKFIEDVSLASDQDELEEKKEAVRIMTIHAAKGLEFDYVFIVGLEEGLFPLERHFADEELTDSEKEEERRLFYVAVTRARKKIFLSMASSRNLFGIRQFNTPSVFLTEIPDEIIEAETMENNFSKKVIYF
jgi:DNA helicase-2/ATP-dependent DNA helicase PcrA